MVPSGLTPLRNTHTDSAQLCTCSHIIHTHALWILHPISSSWEVYTMWHNKTSLHTHGAERSCTHPYYTIFSSTHTHTNTPWSLLKSCTHTTCHSYLCTPIQTYMHLVRSHFPPLRKDGREMLFIPYTLLSPQQITSQPLGTSSPQWVDAWHPFKNHWR